MGIQVYPECGSAGQDNASPGRWAYWRASLPECSLRTKYQWTWYSPAVERETRLRTTSAAITRHSGILLPNSHTADRSCNFSFGSTTRNKCSEHADTNTSLAFLEDVE